MNAKKLVKQIISTIALLGVLAVIVHGVVTSEFNDVKKYDEEDTNFEAKKAKTSKKRIKRINEKNRRVEIKSEGMASLGMFEINTQGGRTLTMNLFLQYRDNENSSWYDKSTKDEIVDKGVVLRSTVINTIGHGSRVSPSDRKMKDKIIKNLNRRLAGGKIKDIYFGSFIIQ